MKSIYHWITKCWINKVDELLPEPNLQSDHHGIDGGHWLVSQVLISMCVNLLQIRYLPNYSLAEELKWGKVFTRELIFVHSLNSGPRLWLCIEKLQRLDGISREKGPQHPSILQQGHNWNLLCSAYIALNENILTFFTQCFWYKSAAFFYTSLVTVNNIHCDIGSQDCLKYKRWQLPPICGELQCQIICCSTRAELWKNHTV